MKKLLLFFAVMLMHLHVQADTWDGTSSDKSWYDATLTEFHIYNAAQLKGLADLVNNDTIDFKDCKIFLEDDIDLDNKLWTPIGFGNSTPRVISFRGSFYGQYNSINNLFIDDNQLPWVYNEHTIGLFGYFDSGTISELNVNASIVSHGDSYMYLGAIGGKGGDVIRCSCNTVIEYNPGSAIFKRGYIGLLVGYANNVYRCESDGIFSIDRGYLSDCYLGGIAGCAGSVYECLSKGKIGAVSLGSSDIVQVGGICGGASIIEDCIFTGQIDAYDYSNNTSKIYAFGICPGALDLLWGGECVICNVISAPSSFKSNSSYAHYKGLVASDIQVSVSDAYYVKELAIGNEYGIGVTRDYLKSGIPLEGFNTDIWEFKENEYPSLIALKTKPKYILTYYIDDELYKEYKITEGMSVTPEKEPEKEGYTFSGWSKIPKVMPAHDVIVTGKFIANKYKLTYQVDGTDFKIYEIEYGAAITPESTPTKEGYTFSGWSEIPETMPAYDVTVAGTFTINKYILTYLVDGVKYKSYEVNYGETISPEAEPTKDGYTFSGWSWIPTKMPAENVTITGSFVPNMYKLIYVVDGEIYKTYELACGSSITSEKEPTKEGYIFSGWSYIPNKMPAEDVTVTGKFTINSYTLTYMIDNEVYKQVVYEFGSTVIPEPQPAGDYATFEWIDVPQTMPAHDVVVNASYTSGIIDVLMTTNRTVRIYSPNGKKLEKLQKGLNIVVLDDGTVKKVVIH